MAAAAGAKKEMKVDIKVDAFSECQKEDKNWALGLKGVASKCKPIPFKDKAEVDPRKWTEAKLNKEAEAAGVMGLKLFSQRIVQFKEQLDKKKKDEKTIIKELIAEYDDFSGKFVKALSLWLEELASGKADNAKSLKDCGGALEKLDKIEFKDAFSKPREKAVSVFKPLATDSGGDKDAAKAVEGLESARSDLLGTGEEAKIVVKTLMSAARKTKSDKNVDPELVAFAVKVLKNEKVFDAFSKGADEFKEVLDEAIEAAKGGKLDKKEAAKHLKTLEGLKSLDTDVKTVVELAKKLVPEFDKIKGKLK